MTEVWVGYNDIRDDIILEFENVYITILRFNAIYLIIKMSIVIFRSSINDFNESNNIIRRLGEWALKNKVRTQEIRL